MKLKQQPEDFQVEELTDIAPTGQGAFALYRLEKRGWSTPDALAAVRRRCAKHLNEPNGAVSTDFQVGQKV